MRLTRSLCRLVMVVVVSDSLALQGRFGSAHDLAESSRVVNGDVG
jgi:hypothetical protein